MSQLWKHGRPVRGVLDLLGTGELAHTSALGWALAQSETFALQLTSDVGGDPWVPESVWLERQLADEEAADRTDVELRDGERTRLVIEAKVGTNWPSVRQLAKYAHQRLGAGGVLLVVSHVPTIAAKDLATLGKHVDVRYRSWRRIRELASRALSSVATHSIEGRVLGELIRYLEKDQEVQAWSNRVWVVPLSLDRITVAGGDDEGPRADLHWYEVVERTAATSTPPRTTTSLPRQISPAT